MSVRVEEPNLLRFKGSRLVSLWGGTDRQARPSQRAEVLRVGVSDMSSEVGSGFGTSTGRTLKVKVSGICIGFLGVWGGFGVDLTWDPSTQILL